MLRRIRGAVDENFWEWRNTLGYCALRELGDSIVTMSNDVSAKFFGLAKAYLDCAATLVESTVQPKLEVFCASACMFNARLSVELFLKGMIVLRSPHYRSGGHDLYALSLEFKRLYPGSEFSWNVPFVPQVIGGTDQKREEKVRENVKDRPLDQIFRYPTNNKGELWEMVSDVSRSWLIEFLEKIRLDMERIERKVSG